MQTYNIDRHSELTVINLTRDQRLNSKHEEIINRQGDVLLILEGKFRKGQTGSSGMR